MVATGVRSLASKLALAAGGSLVFAMAVSAAQDRGDAAAPTAKEQALMEHLCRSVQVGPAHDAYGRCLEAQLLSLRADFGRDLSRLPAAARTKIDAACSPAQTLRGREGYLECLSGQLRALRVRPARKPPAAQADAPVATAAAAPLPVEAPPSAESESPLLNARTAAAAVGAVVVGGALVFFGLKARRSRHVCPTCGTGVPAAAELCPACRRHAADAKRRAASGRAEHQRTAEAEARRQREEAEARRLEEQRRQEEERRRRAEEAARREEEARQLAEARERAAAAVSSDADESVFDPYVALGLSPGASDDEVRAAFEEARLKYDPEAVDHLGYDAQQHFARKWNAARRAYELLAGSLADK
jgi:hypothetical protein